MTTTRPNELLGFDPMDTPPNDVETIVGNIMGSIDTEAQLQRAIILFCHPTIRKVVPDIDCYWSVLADLWLFEVVPKVITKMTAGQLGIVTNFIKSKHPTSWCILGFLILTVKHDDSVRFTNKLLKLLDETLVHHNTMLNGWFGFSLLNMLKQRPDSTSVAKANPIKSWSQIIDDGSIMNTIDCSAILVTSSTKKFDVVKSDSSMVTVTVGHSIHFIEILITDFCDSNCATSGWVISLERAKLKEGLQIHLTMDHAKVFDLSQSTVLELADVNVNISLVDRKYIPTLVQMLTLELQYHAKGAEESGRGDFPRTSSPLPTKRASPVITTTETTCDLEYQPEAECLFFDSSPVKIPMIRPRRYIDSDDDNDDSGISNDNPEFRQSPNRPSSNRPNSATAYSNLADLGRKRHKLVRELHLLQQKAQDKTSELQIVDIDIQKAMVDLGVALEESK